MTFTSDQLTRLRDNLDGLGYPMGPRGLFGIGNEQNAFDAAAFGNLPGLNSNRSMRSISAQDAYTRSAIFQFQRDNNMAANGNYGKDLNDRVETVVRNMQNNLKLVLGKKDFPLTGYFGLQTFQTVKEYQKIKGLPITGIATASVRRQLQDEARRLTTVPTPSPTPAPKPTGTEAQAKLDQISSIKDRYQKGLILTDDFVREVIAAIP